MKHDLTLEHKKELLKHLKLQLSEVRRLKESSSWDNSRVDYDERVDTLIREINKLKKEVEEENE